MEILTCVLAVIWAMIASKIMDNFAEDLPKLSKWRFWALHIVVLIFAPVFFIEELLEIVIDWIIGEEQSE
jgi:hypothetical protein